MDTVADILAATIIVAPEVDLERTTRVDVVAVVTAVMWPEAVIDLDLSAETILVNAILSIKSYRWLIDFCGWI